MVDTRINPIYTRFTCTFTHTGWFPELYVHMIISSNTAAPLYGESIDIGIDIDRLLWQFYIGFCHIFWKKSSVSYCKILTWYEPVDHVFSLCVCVTGEKLGPVARLVEILHG